MRTMIIPIALAAFTLSTVAAPAAAEERTAYVEISDLNIRSESGMKELQTRVHSAIRAVCPSGEVRSAKDSLNARQCVEAASEDAEQQIGQLRRGRVEILAIRADRINRNQ